MKRTILLALLLGCGVAQADPSPTIKRLMNEPASMLDLGLDHLWKYLHEEFPPNRPFGPLTSGSPRIFTNYNYEKNEVEVFVLFDTGATYPGSAKDACAGLLKVLRSTLTFGDLAPWPGYFSHYGYTVDKAYDAELKAELPKLMVIRVTLIDYKNTPANLLTCFGPLMKDDIAYRDGP